MNKTVSMIWAVVVVQLLLVPAFSLADHSVLSDNADVPVSTHPACTIDMNLTIGSRGDAVTCLQKHLVEDGFLGLAAPTGYFGDITKAAVMKWQSEKGIAATGFFGAHSREVFSGHHEEAEQHTPVAVAHPVIDVAQWPSAPSVAIKVHPDAMSGYNLEITTQNFRFAPEHASGAVVPNEGHAHLMVGGKKLARVYGNWFHIPAETLQSGQNEVLLTLNANDHSDLQLNGVRIQAQQTITK